MSGTQHSHALAMHDEPYAVIFPVSGVDDAERVPTSQDGLLPIVHAAVWLAHQANQAERRQAALSNPSGMNPDDATVMSAASDHVDRLNDYAVLPITLADGSAGVRVKSDHRRFFDVVLQHPDNIDWTDPHAAIPFAFGDLREEVVATLQLLQSRDDVQYLFTSTP